jgi:hypothetical protein
MEALIVHCGNVAHVGDDLENNGFFSDHSPDTESDREPNPVPPLLPVILIAMEATEAPQANASSKKRKLNEEGEAQEPEHIPVRTPPPARSIPFLTLAQNIQDFENFLQSYQKLQADNATLKIQANEGTALKTTLANAKQQAETAQQEVAVQRESNTASSSPPRTKWPS